MTVSDVEPLNVGTRGTQFFRMLVPQERSHLWDEFISHAPLPHRKEVALRHIHILDPYFSYAHND